MKHLLDYLFENLLFESEDKIDDKKIEKAQKRLLKLLRQKDGDLKDFVGRLNSILLSADKQDNTKIWMSALKDLFDGRLDKNIDSSKFTIEIKPVDVKDLKPTQSEIDIQNSTKHWIKNPQNIGGLWEKDFGSQIPIPVLVYDDGSQKWLIDGHHRWSQVYLMNPEGSLHCMVVKGDIDYTQFLELTQAAIAAAIGNPDSSNPRKGQKLKSGKAAPENDVFGKKLKDDKDFAERIKFWVSHKLDNGNISERSEDDVKKIEEEVVKQVSKHNKDIKDFDDVVNMMVENRKNMPRPAKNAAPRPVMPQTDSAAPDGNDQNAGPGTEDSALAFLSGGKNGKESTFPKLNK